MIKVLVPVFIVAILVVGAIMVAKSTKNTITHDERTELKKLRRLVNELTISASEHAVLGEGFATIALAKISETRKELE